MFCFPLTRKTHTNFFFVNVFVLEININKPRESYCAFHIVDQQRKKKTKLRTGKS